MTAIKVRRGTAAQWQTANPVLSAGEPGWENDAKRLKVGDGVNPWNSLEYILPTAMIEKLAGIQSGATANDSDTELRDRATHTGTISITDVTSLSETLGGKVTNLINTQVPRVFFYSAVSDPRPTTDAGVLVWWIATATGLGLPTNALGNDFVDLEG